MQCKSCGNFESRVIKTYVNIARNIRIRIRICIHCGARIRTEEKPILSSFKKMNPNKRIEYDR